MKKIISSTTNLLCMLILLFTGCEKEVAEKPSVDFTAPSAAKLGETIIINITSDASYVVVWPGEPGYDYESRNTPYENEEGDLTWPNGYPAEQGEYPYTYSNIGEFNITVIATNVAQDGSDVKQVVVQKKITVTDDSKTFSSFWFSRRIRGEVSENEVVVPVPYDEDVTSVKPIFEAGFAKVYVGDQLQVSGETVQDFTNPVTYTIVPQDGSEPNDVVVRIDRSAPSSEKQIEEFGIKGYSTETVKKGNVVTVYLPAGTSADVLDSLYATFKVSSDAEMLVSNEVQKSGSNYHDFTSPVVYTVKAQDGSTMDYIVRVLIALNNDNEMESFTIVNLTPNVEGTITGVEESGFIMQFAVNVNVPSDADITSLVASFEVDPTATVTVGNVVQESGVTVNDFTKPVEYVVMAENGSTAVYVVTVTTGNEN